MYSETVINRLRKAREMAGLTLADLASTTGYAQTTLSSIENHHDQPSKRLLAKWIDALGLSETWLNTGEGDPFAKPGLHETQAARADLAAPIRFRIQKAREHASDLLQELDQIERDLTSGQLQDGRKRRLKQI